jgi:glycosyltransferase involved in cell wall biosynthesis
MNEKSMVSVIIPSYNSEKTIEKCLSSLQKQNYEGVFEVILVDSSEDGTSAIVKNLFPNVNVIWLNKKTDPGTARNLGIEKAKGEILLFLDSDCYVQPDWMSKMVKTHQEQPDLSAVGGAVIPEYSNKNSVIYAGYMAEFREFIPQHKKKYIRHIPTMNISYKKKIFSEYGYFDSRFYPQEDLIFNYRLSGNGEKILFDPTIVVTHRFRKELNSFLTHQKRIGEITARVLKILPLPGYRIVRHPFLFVIIWPILPMIKFVRTIAVFYRYQRKELMRNISAILFLKLGLLYWILGFTKGVCIRKTG